MTLQEEAFPWKRALIWLAFLGSFFFLSYGFSNAWAAKQQGVPCYAFPWETKIPFVPWTILPYWSIDLLYGFSFLMCLDRKAVDTHAYRLLTAQVVAVSCFLLFPLQFCFVRPASDGWIGWLFDLLGSFDQPFNQAPSLHIALLVIIWERFVRGTKGFWRLLTHLWAGLIAVSVLTTYQHHFIDVPTGAALGLGCLWLFPENAAPLWANWQWSSDSKRRRLGGYYLLASLALLGLGCLGSFWLWCLWPALSLFLVSLIYFGLGAAGFQKEEGHLSTAVFWLLLPYRISARINRQIWLGLAPSSRFPSQVTEKIWLGPFPSRAMQNGAFDAALDLTAEFAAPKMNGTVMSLPWLDLVSPTPRALLEAARKIDALHQHSHRVLVFCALGYSRSAAALAAWLLYTHQAPSVESALTLIMQSRPQVVLKADVKKALQAFLSLLSMTPNLLNPTPEYRISVAVQWLSGGRLIDQVSSVLTLLAAVQWLWPIYVDSIWRGLMAGIVFIGILEKYYAFRVDFDRRVFSDWAARLAHPEQAFSVAWFDECLTHMIGAKIQPERSLEERIQAACRLFQKQRALLIMQFLSVFLGVLFI